jgi:hypothetical protein
MWSRATFKIYHHHPHVGVGEQGRIYIVNQKTYSPILCQRNTTIRRTHVWRLSKRCHCHLHVGRRRATWDVYISPISLSLPSSSTKNLKSTHSLAMSVQKTTIYLSHVWRLLKKDFPSSCLGERSSSSICVYVAYISKSPSSWIFQ